MRTRLPVPGRAGLRSQSLAAATSLATRLGGQRAARERGHPAERGCCRGTASSSGRRRTRPSGRTAVARASRRTPGRAPARRAGRRATRRASSRRSAAPARRRPATSTTAVARRSREEAPTAQWYSPPSTTQRPQPGVPVGQVVAVDREDDVGGLAGLDRHAGERLQLARRAGGPPSRAGSRTPGRPPGRPRSPVLVTGTRTSMPAAGGRRGRLAVGEGRVRQAEAERVRHLLLARVVAAVADEQALAVADVPVLAGEVQVRRVVLQPSGMVSASRPDGLTRPNSTSAIAPPPAWPSSQPSRIAGTAGVPRGGARARAPLDSTTTVRGLTARDRARAAPVRRPGRSMSSRSKPSDSCVQPTKTSATSLASASATASASRSGRFRIGLRRPRGALLGGGRVDQVAGREQRPSPAPRRRARRARRPAGSG